MDLENNKQLYCTNNSFYGSFIYILFVKKLNISMLETIIFTIIGYFLISVACIFIITINKSWSLSISRNNWSKIVHQNSYAIAGSVAVMD